MSALSEERVAAAGWRTSELLSNFDAAIGAHMEAHSDVDPSDLQCDVVTATVQLMKSLVQVTGTDPLRMLAALASELGVETITADRKSVGHA